VTGAGLGSWDRNSAGGVGACWEGALGGCGLEVCEYGSGAGKISQIPAVVAPT